MLMSTVGAAQNMVIDSSRICRKTAAGSTLRRQTCVPPQAVMVHTKVQPFAWNIGSTHR